MTRSSSKGLFSDAKRLGVLLRKMADCVEASSDREINDLLRGNCELRILEVKPLVKALASARPDSYFSMTYSEIAEKLRSAQTREVGRQVINNQFPTRASVEKFARFLDLPVQRSDTSDGLRERIVESEIGSRLRSEAVQGKQTK